MAMSSTKESAALTATGATRAAGDSRLSNKYCLVRKADASVCVDESPPRKRQSIGNSSNAVQLTNNPLTNAASNTVIRNYIQNDEEETCKSESESCETRRFIVDSVEQNDDSMELLVRSAGDQAAAKTTISLRGFWAWNTRVRPGDTVQLAALPNASLPPVDNAVTLDDGDGNGRVLIVHPELLLPTTTVVNAVGCLRRAFVQHIFKQDDVLTNEDERRAAGYLLSGSLAHALFQSAITPGNSFLQKSLTEQVRETLRNETKLLLDDFEQVLSERDLIALAQPFEHSASNWLRTCRTGSSCLQLKRVLDIEDTYVSNRYALKGKTDVTVVDCKNRVVPLELKTSGNTARVRTSVSNEHRAQLLLYLLCMADGFERTGANSTPQKRTTALTTREPIERGVLLYLPEGSMHPVQAEYSCSLALLQRRNELTHHLAHPLVASSSGWTLNLPEPITEERVCSRCSQLRNCSVMRVAENVRTDDGQFPVDRLFSSLWPHLSDSAFNYVARWVRLLLLEFSEVEIRQRNRSASTTKLDGNRNDSSTDDAGWSNAGDVVLRTALSNLRRLLLDESRCNRLRALLVDGDSPSSVATFSKTSVLQVRHLVKPLNSEQRTAVLETLFATDCLLVEGYPGCGKTSTICTLIRVLTSLGFRVLVAAYTNLALDNVLTRLLDVQDSVRLVRLGNAEKTHFQVRPRSLDTLLSDAATRNHGDALEALRHELDAANVVATTCASARLALLSHYAPFDVVILDEASQILEPLCIGVLTMARRFVLVGDAFQLPPLVRSSEARRTGMQVSLFERLAAQWRDAHCRGSRRVVCQLRTQYRMNSVVMTLANRLVYSNTLCCASETVASRVYTAACESPLRSTANDKHPTWLKRTLSDALHDSVLFLNVTRNAPPAQRCTNEQEARVVVTVVQRLAESGLPLAHMGVISPYRAQVQLLLQKLAPCFECLAPLQVNTVDQFQGTEKELVLISFVRSANVALAERNESEAVNLGGILTDLRRLNVAITRARSKLILVGDAVFLKTHFADTLGKLLSNLSDSQILDVAQSECDFDSDTTCVNCN